MKERSRRGPGQGTRAADHWLVDAIVTMDEETRKGAVIGGVASASAIAVLYLGAWLTGLGVWR